VKQWLIIIFINNEHLLLLLFLLLCRNHPATEEIKYRLKYGHGKIEGKEESAENGKEAAVNGNRIIYTKRYIIYYYYFYYYFFFLNKLLINK